MLIKIYLLIVYMLQKLGNNVGSTDDGIVTYLRRGSEGVTINNDSFPPPPPFLYRLMCAMLTRSSTHMEYRMITLWS